LAKINSTTTAPITGKRRGRPLGSTNKPKGEKRKYTRRQPMGNFNEHDVLLQAAGLMTARDAIDAQLSLLLGSINTK
jgi:hypothetical protein